MKIKVKASEIEQVVKDAYQKGKDAKAAVEKFLNDKILDKKCEDLLDQTVSGLVYYSDR